MKAVEERGEEEHYVDKKPCIEVCQAWESVLRCLYRDLFCRQGLHATSKA